MRFRLIEDYLIETIADVKKYYPTISDKDFDRIIKLDPTTNIEKDVVGKYSKWLLNLFKKGNLNNEGHVKDLLNRFESEKNNLVNKDIMKYKSLEEVDNMLNDENSYKNKSHRQEVRQRQKDRKNADLSKDAELVYEDSDWEVWVPKTYAASCKLGQGANWCTASTESNYYYYKYKNDYGGEYYIIINKHDPEDKYQFHFESGQFMDRHDYSIDLDDFMSENKNLSNYFLKNVINYDKINISKLSKDIGEIHRIDEHFLKNVFDYNVYEIYAPYDFNINYDDIINEYIGYIDDSSWEDLEKLDINKDNIEEMLEYRDDILDAIENSAGIGLAYGYTGDLNETISSKLKNIIGDFYIEDVYNSVTKRQESYIIRINPNEPISNINWNDMMDLGKYGFLADIFDERDTEYAYGFDSEMFNDELQNQLYDIMQ